MVHVGGGVTGEWLRWCEAYPIAHDHMHGNGDRGLKTYCARPTSKRALADPPKLVGLKTNQLC